MTSFDDLEARVTALEAQARRKKKKKIHFAYQFDRDTCLQCGKTVFVDGEAIRLHTIHPEKVTCT